MNPSAAMATVAGAGPKSIAEVNRNVSDIEACTGTPGTRSDSRPKATASTESSEPFRHARHRDERGHRLGDGKQPQRRHGGHVARQHTRVVFGGGGGGGVVVAADMTRVATPIARALPGPARVDTCRPAVVRKCRQCKELHWIAGGPEGGRAARSADTDCVTSRNFSSSQPKYQLDVVDPTPKFVASYR